MKRGAPPGSIGELDDVFRKVIIRLLVLTALLLLAGQAAVSVLSSRSFERILLPEVEAKARISGELAAAQIGRALELGIPIGSLVGMDEFLDGWIDDNPLLSHLRVALPDGAVLYADSADASAAATVDPPTRALTVPVYAGDEVVAHVVVGMAESEVPSVLLDLRFEIATVLFVSLLIGIEFLLVFGMARMSAPTRFVREFIERAADGNFTQFMGLRDRNEFGRIVAAYNAGIRRLNGEFGELYREAEEVRAEQLDRSVRARILRTVEKIRDRYQFVEVGTERVREFRSPFDARLALFFFMVSQELSRPFLPLVFDRVYDPMEAVSREIFISLPITGFMLAVLVVTPVAGVLTERISPRSLFLAGVLPSVAGYVGTALATDMYAAMAWWVVAGVGYGVIFITSQIYIAENTAPDRRAAGMAVFSGACFAAFVCGPALGGLMADRLGYVNTLLGSAGLAAISGTVAFLSLDPDPLDAGTARRPAVPGLAGIARLLSNRRFFAVTFLSAMPAKIALAGVFFYLVPVYLNELGNTQSVIGRIMMVYGVACIVVTPIAARWSDRLGRTDAFVALGGVLGAVGCAVPSFLESSAGVAVGVGVLGLGHAMLTAPQLASVQKIAADVGPEVDMGVGAVVGVFRTVERVGTALGAVLLAALVANFGYSSALAATAAGTLLLGLLYAAAAWRRGERGAFA